MIPLIPLEKKKKLEKNALEMVFTTNKYAS